MTTLDSAQQANAEQALRAGIEAGTPAWVLVDPMLGEPLPGVQYEHSGAPGTARTARERAWRREICVIELHPKVALLPTQYPYLVGLLDAQDEWVAHTLALAQAERAQSQCEGMLGEGGAAHRIAGWLTSSLGTEPLAQALGTLMRLQTEARTNARYLRLADRRVLDWTLRVAGVDRFTAALGRIQRWHYLDARGQLRSLASVGEQPQALRFSASEWQLMEHGESVHRVVAMVLGETAAAALPQDALHDRAFAALNASAQALKRWPQRFTHARDSHVWAALHVLCGEPAGNDELCRMMDAAPEPDEPPEPVRDLALALAETLGLRAAEPSVQ